MVHVVLFVVTEMAVEFLIKNHCEHVTQHRRVRILISGDRSLCRITTLQMNAQIPILVPDLRSFKLWSLLKILLFLLFLNQELSCNPEKSFFWYSNYLPVNKH